MQPSDDDLDTLLSQMPREQPPPASLEAATVQRLQRSGLLGRPTRSWQPWARAAMMLIVFGIGWGVRGRTMASPPAEGPAPGWAIVLYGGATTDSASHAVRAREYGAWAGAAHPDAQVVGGEALGEAGPIMGDSPSAAAIPDPIVGFFLVQAADREAAERLARTCPHLRYGGRVVVRAVLPT